jgi:hypothetical protein
VNASIDHLVIAADSLEQGEDWRAATFGVQPSGGGKHPLMGRYSQPSDCHQQRELPRLLAFIP